MRAIFRSWDVMIDANAFINAAAVRGFDFYSGVPCSFLTPLINRVASNRHITYVGATSEGEAIAIAAGAWLAGRRRVVMCQNSGLGNAVNPLTSLNAPFRIPTLFVTTWRGEPGIPDEPQHELMGLITHDLIRLLGLEQAPFPAQVSELAAAFARATERMAATGLPYALVMRKGDIAGGELRDRSRALPETWRRADFPQEGARSSRAAALERFLQLVAPDAKVIATTGKCGRELF